LFASQAEKNQENKLQKIITRTSVTYAGVPYVSGAMKINMRNKTKLKRTRIIGPLIPISEYCEGRGFVLPLILEIG
jgi:hypothetical protein